MANVARELDRFEASIGRQWLWTVEGHLGGTEWAVLESHSSSEAACAAFGRLSSGRSVDGMRVRGIQL